MILYLGTSAYRILDERPSAIKCKQLAIQSSLGGFCLAWKSSQTHLLWKYVLMDENPHSIMQGFFS